MKNETLTAILNEKDKLSAYMGVGVDYYKGETGKSGADEVYIGAEPPTDPQVKLWVDTEDQSYVPVEWKDVGNKPDFATVATSGDYKDLKNKPDLFSGNYEDLTNKPTIPDAYTLPTASTDTLGGVKVDGSTITIADGVISSAGGGSSLENTFDNNDYSKSYKVGYDTNANFGTSLRNKIGNTSAHRNLLIGYEHNISEDIDNGLYCGYNNQTVTGRGHHVLIGAYNNVVCPNNWNADNVVLIGNRNSCENTSNSPGGYNVLIGRQLMVTNNNTGLIMFGTLNILDENDYAFVIANGTPYGGRSHALSVDRTTGNLAIAGTMSSAGADYAEFFEWKDGNPEAEDRVGYIVALDGDKLILANEGDYILGVVSGTATVLGDNPEWNWAKRWVTDDFGRIQYEDKVIHHEAEERNGETIPAWDETIKAPVINPDYDPDQEYTKRADRPEWSAVGMMGKLYVRDDGTCQVNGYCKPINGVATASTSGTMRVIERVSDNVIRVVIK